MEKEKKIEPKKSRCRATAEAKEIIDEIALKNIINLKYSKFNDSYNVVKEAIDNMTEKLKKPLAELIDFVDTSLELVMVDDGRGKKRYDMKFNLTEEELNFLAIKIPTVCMYVQEFLNDRTIDTSLAEHILEDTVTEYLKSITGGNAQERLRLASQKAQTEQIVFMIKRQVAINMKSYIDRADKIYDGVKKVLDGINREKGIFGKSTKFTA